MATVGFSEWLVALSSREQWWMPLVARDDLVGLESIPFLYPFEAENKFMWSYHSFCRQFWWASWAASSIYIILVKFVGPKLMESRKAFNLRGPLKYWNLFLALFSFLGALRTLPYCLGFLYYHGFAELACKPAIFTYGAKATGFWVMLFIYSKYFELIDTLFLVLRKRDVSLLHWYHHFSVLLYCWHALINMQPTGLIFVAMNYTVHAVMYFYYYLTCCGMRLRWAKFVTVIQLLQMVFGVLAVCGHVYLLSNSSNSGALDLVGSVCAWKDQTTVDSFGGATGTNVTHTSITSYYVSTAFEQTVDGTADIVSGIAVGVGKYFLNAETLSTMHRNTGACFSGLLAVVFGYPGADPEAAMRQRILSGHAVNASGIRGGFHCDGSSHNLVFACLMYISYFLLFLQFYLERYSSRSAPEASPTSPTSPPAFWVRGRGALTSAKTDKKKQ